MSKFANFVSRYTPLGWYFNLLGKIVGSDSSVSNVIDSILNQITGAGLTGAEKESITLQDTLNKENATIDYNRQRDLLQDFGPRWQMEELSKAYDDIGLNKMGLAGTTAAGASASTPSTSAASAPSPQAGFLDAVSEAINAGMQQKGLDISDFQAKSSDKLNRAQGSVYAAQARGLDIENKWKDKMLEAEYKNKLSTNLLTKANTRKILAESDNLEWQALYAPDLFQAQIDEHTSNVARAYSDIERNVSEISLNDKRKSEIDSIVAKNGAEIRQIDALIDKISQEYWNLCAEEDLTRARIDEVNKLVEKYNAEIKEIGSKINLNETDLQYYIWNHPRVSRAAGFQWNNSSYTGTSSIQSLEGWDTPSLQGELRRRGAL